MSFQEVAALDADVTIAIGKVNKETGKPYPKSAEGYFLGSRKVESKRGDSFLHFLQTEKGNLGVWGTTDLNRKLSTVNPGTMVRITSTGMKPTPNGDMYTYKVESDKANTIEVSAQEDASTLPAASDEEGDDNEYDTSAALQDSRRQEVEGLLKRNRKN